MRGAVLFVCLALAGCVSPPDLPAEASMLSFTQAAALATPVVGADWVLAEATARSPLDGRVPSGGADVWQLVFLDAHGTAYVKVEVSSQRVAEKERGAVAGDTDGGSPSGFWSHGCPVAWSLDSPAIGQAVAATPHWQWVWDVAAVREAPGPSFGELDSAHMELTCVEGAQYWSVLTPFMRNADGSVSVRSFMLTLEGKLAGFADSDHSNGLSMGGSGLAVQRHFLWPEWDALSHAGDATFDAPGATRLAIHVEVAWQGLPLPGAKGALDILDPAGRRHVLGWDTTLGQRNFSLVVPDIGPTAAFGEWKVLATSESPWGLGHLRFHSCTGFPSAQVTSEDPACALLAR